MKSKSLKEQKDNIREQIALLKNQHQEDELLDRSDEVMTVVEILGVFQEAKRIFIYNSIKDEVSTLNFMEKWKNEKEFYLPVVQKDQLVFRKYTSENDLVKSSFGILEPTGEDFKDFSTIDLIIVPGVAFDRKKNRVGYGKGYYDRFLSNLKAPRVGVCFDFQLLNFVPTDENDIAMDYIVSENDLIW